MGFRKLLFLVVAAFLCVAGVARAQVGVYGMYEGTDVTNITCLTTTPCSATNGSTKPFGGVGGVYYDFKSFGPVRLGVDFRGEFLHANKSAASSTGGNGATREHSAMGGVRAVFHTPISFLRPYGQASFGWASTNATETNVETYDSYLKYEVFAGADVRVFPILDVRVLELGIGGMDRIGTGLGNSSLPVKSIGAGLVFHLP